VCGARLGETTSWIRPTEGEDIMSRNSKLTPLIGTAAAAVLLLTACGGSGGESPNEGLLDGVDLTAGSKEFTESVVLSQITSKALEDAGASIEDQTGIS